MCLAFNKPLRCNLEISMITSHFKYEKSTKFALQKPLQNYQIVSVLSKDLSHFLSIQFECLVNTILLNSTASNFYSFLLSLVPRIYLFF